MVKTWESEASHKVDLNQWTSIDVDNYTVQVNNGPILEGKKAFEMGNYNAIMRECPMYQKCNFSEYDDRVNSKLYFFTYTLRN